MGVVVTLAPCFHSFGFISPLISSRILGTYWPGEFIFQCPIFLPFHTVHTFFLFSLEIPWFGFLSLISSLGLSSGHSGPVFTLRTDAAEHASLPSPHSLVTDASKWATSPLAVVVKHIFCGISPAPGYFALWDSKTPHRQACERVSYFVQASPPSQFPPQDGSTSLNLLVQFLSFIFCPTFFEEIGLPFWVSCVFHLHSEVVLFKLLSIQMIFWWICEGESGLPFLFLCHLGSAPISRFSILFHLSLFPFLCQYHTLLKTVAL